MTTARQLEDPLEHELDPALQKELLKFPGKWVAITRSDIVVIGDSPEEVMRDAREAGVEAAILHHVPEDAEISYFL